MKYGYKAKLLLATMLSLSLVACGEEKANEVAETSATKTESNVAEVTDTRSDFTVTDEVGNELTIPGDVKNIYAPGLEDYLVALGVTPIAQWSSGTSATQYLQKYLNGIEEISFANGIPSVETIIDLEPDLVLFPTAFYAQNGVYENYSKIASTFVFNNALGDVVASAQTIGKLLNLEKEAETAIEKYKEKLEKAKTTLADIVTDKKAVYINANAKAIFLVGNFHYGGYVLSELGFAQSDLVVGEASANISLEMISDLDADYIFINDNDGLGTAFLQEIQSSPLWDELDAVQAGNVFNVKGDHWRSSGLLAYELIIDDIVEFLK